MSIKVNIKQLRESIGMSQADLALRIGLSRPTVIKIEKGERALTVSETEKVLEIFGVAAEYAAMPTDMRIDIPQKHVKKFKQVLLYILERTAGKPNVGMTTLYKLLYFIDFDYYEKYEEQLMGLTYIKNTFGPTPREFVKVVEDMKKANELEEVKSTYFTYEQRKFLPHTKADLSVLNGQELEMIESVLSRYADKSATELSNLSHEDTPWSVAEMGENIEYEHVFYRPEKLSVREYEAL
jgi:transcriptional regulator with XRE-family HTH domain